MIRTEIDSLPSELDAASRRVMQLEIEETALKREADAASAERLKALQKELQEARTEADSLRAQYETEKGAITGIRELRSRIDAVKADIAKAEHEYDLNRVAELRYGQLRKLEEELRAKEADAEKESASGRLLREEVTEEEIADIVSLWTGIPVTRLVESEKEKQIGRAHV